LNAAALSPQQAKSAAMRRRILEAATAALAEDGYGRLSIARVVERAGVSQGALQHHFPARDDLVAATAEFLLGRSVKWFHRAKDQLKRGRGGLGDVIRRSWREQFRTPEYAALLEILIAARTDEQLRNRIAPTLDEWRLSIDREIGALLAADGRSKAELETLLTLGRAVMTGLLVHDDLTREPRRIERAIERFISLASLEAPR
jgi:AcrR family transcriptional regulator